MDRPFITASDYIRVPFIAASNYIAESRAAPKCKLHLILLNLVEMLWFDQPIATNLPPLLLSNLPFPFHWQSCRGSRGSSRRRRRRRCTGRRGGSRCTPLLRARSHRRCWPRGRHGMLNPTCPSAPSPGLDKPASSTCQCRRGNMIYALACVKRCSHCTPAGPAQTGSRMQQDKWQEISG